MKLIDPHIHCVSRTTDDYQFMARCGVVAVSEPAFWAGYDRGSAASFADAEQRNAAEASRRVYQSRLSAAGKGTITTEIRDAPDFYYAEEYHQQYLAKNPDGYCGIGGCGVPYKPAELAVGAKA